MGEHVEELPERFSMKLDDSLGLSVASEGAAADARETVIDEVSTPQNSTEKEDRLSVKTESCLAQDRVASQATNATSESGIIVNAEDAYAEHAVPAKTGEAADPTNATASSVLDREAAPTLAIEDAFHQDEDDAPPQKEDDKKKGSAPVDSAAEKPKSSDAVPEESQDKSGKKGKKNKKNDAGAPAATRKGFESPAKETKVSGDGDEVYDPMNPDVTKKHSSRGGYYGKSSYSNNWNSGGGWNSQSWNKSDENARTSNSHQSTSNSVSGSNWNSNPKVGSSTAVQKKVGDKGQEPDSEAGWDETKHYKWKDGKWVVYKDKPTKRCASDSAPVKGKGKGGGKTSMYAARGDSAVPPAPDSEDDSDDGAANDAMMCKSIAPPMKGSSPALRKIPDRLCEAWRKYYHDSSWAPHGDTDMLNLPVKPQYVYPKKLQAWLKRVYQKGDAVPDDITVLPTRVQQHLLSAHIDMTPRTSQLTQSGILKNPQMASTPMFCSPQIANMQPVVVQPQGFLQTPQMQPQHNMLLNNSQAFHHQMQPMQNNQQQMMMQTNQQQPAMIHNNQQQVMMQNNQQPLLQNQQQQLMQLQQPMMQAQAQTALMMPPGLMNVGQNWSWQ